MIKKRLTAGEFFKEKLGRIPISENDNLIVNLMQEYLYYIDDFKALNCNNCIQWLMNNYPIRFEQDFIKNYASNFTNEKEKSNFIALFNSKIVIEIENGKLAWKVNSLFSRLNIFAQNYFKINDKNKEYKIKLLPEF